MDTENFLKEMEAFVPGQMLAQLRHVPRHGDGGWYTDTEGRSYLDWSSGIFTNTFGHDDWDNESDTSLSNIHGRYSMESLLFYRKLFSFLPDQNYRAVAYGDGGGYTVDRGLTVLYQHFSKDPDAVIAAFREGFHGKTLGTKLLINQTQRGAFYENLQIPYPNCYRCPYGQEQGSCGRLCIEQTCRTLREHQVRALVFEPVQGTSVLVPPEGFWEAVAAYCCNHNIVLFADEVLTGGGRLGTYLGCTRFGIRPDLIVLTKGLGNGMPLSVMLMRPWLIENPYAARPMEYSATFLEVPRLMHRGRMVLERMEREHTLENVQIRGAQLEAGLKQIKSPFLGDIRRVGLLAGLEFVHSQDAKEPYPEFSRMVFEKCEDLGLELIPGSHILRIAPALNTTDEEIAQGLRLLTRAIAECTQEVEKYR